MKDAQEGDWDSYNAVSGNSEGLYKDRGSRFQAYVFPVSSEEDVKVLLDALKREHHAARHHCYAYRLGYDGARFRANDDGEPSGTAGRQILGEIDSAKLSDVLVVVVRYFGGVLLGVPALGKAYREAAAAALSAAPKTVKAASRDFVLEFAYDRMETVQRLLKGSGAEVVEQKFDLQCSAHIRLRLSTVDIFFEKLKRLNDEKSACIQCRPL